MIRVVQTPQGLHLVVGGVPVGTLWPTAIRVRGKPLLPPVLRGRLALARATARWVIELCEIAVADRVPVREVERATPIKGAAQVKG